MLVTRTGIRSNSGQIGSVTSELRALEGGLNFQSTYYGISKIRCPVLIKFYMYHQLDGGKAVFRLWSRFHRNCGCHGNRKAPIDIIIMGKRCLHVDSFRFDQIYGKKSQASSNFGQIGPHPWASKKNSHIMGKWCITFIFYRIFFELAGKQGRQKISDKIEFRLDGIILCWCFMALSTATVMSSRSVTH